MPLPLRAVSKQLSTRLADRVNCLTVALFFLLFSFTSRAVTTNLCFVWNPAAGAHHYNLYTGTNSASYYRLDPFYGTNGCVTNLIIGIRYYFALTTMGSNGFESTYSAEISWLIGDTNVYVTEISYGQRHVSELLLSYTQPDQFGHTGIMLTNDDARGVIGGVLFTNRSRSFQKWANITNWTIWTNSVTYTNPPPDFYSNYSKTHLPMPPVPQ